MLTVVTLWWLGQVSRGGAAATTCPGPSTHTIPETSRDDYARSAGLLEKTSSSSYANRAQRLITTHTRARARGLWLAAECSVMPTGSEGVLKPNDVVSHHGLRPVVKVGHTRSALRVVGVAFRRPVVRRPSSRNRENIMTIPIRRCMLRTVRNALRDIIAAQLLYTI